MRSFCLLFSLICIFPFSGYTQAPISGTINVYTPVTSIDSCTNSVNVSNPTGFNPGDRVLIIQMKGATIDQTNTATFGDIINYGSAGKYEYATIASASGGNISFVQALLNWYDIAGVVQLVRVPQYTNVTVSGTLTCPAWNGATGGVLVFEVSDTLRLNAGMDVTGKGFRLGPSSSGNGNCHIYDFAVPVAGGNGAYKGEGIVIYNSAVNGGKGKLANGGGGGNMHNGGGAGGGNYGAGGTGGEGWDGCINPSGTGGIGGAALNYSLQRLFLGGGGGGGHQNDGALSTGGNGGGLILLRAGTIVAASGIALKADGLASGDVISGPSDGVGGGGAGGIISISAQAIAGSNMAVSARGGKGGNNATGGGDGAGGGGGGGVIWLSSTSLLSAMSTIITGGAAGYNTVSSSKNGTSGQPGQVMADLVLQESTIPWIPTYSLVISPDTTICAGDTVTLQAIGNHTGATFRWNTGETTPVIKTTVAGTYWLEMNVNRYYCPLRDTVTVSVIYAPVPDLGPDLGVCDKDLPVILSAPQLAGTTYLWSTGQSGDQISVLNSGIFWVEVTHMGCRRSDTVAITVVPTPVVYIGPDTTICEQYPLVFSAGSFPGAAYLWSTGATTPSVRVSTTGTYMLTVNLHGCIVHDTVQIIAMPPPDVDLGGDRDICPEQEIILSDQNGNGNRYIWSTGDTTASITVHNAGTYYLRIFTEYGCEGNDGVRLTYYPKPEVYIGPDTTVCEETPLLLSPRTNQVDSYLWSDGSADTSLRVRYGGTYIVTVQNKCGTTSDTIEIEQIFCDLWLPNAFTPDGDGVNDVFRILGNTGRMHSVSFGIFNRWGERIFHTEDKHAGWDGLFKGVPAQLGTYVYLLQYKMDNSPYIRKGNFHLLR